MSHFAPSLNPSPIKGEGLEGNVSRILCTGQAIAPKDKQGF